MIANSKGLRKIAWLTCLFFCLNQFSITPPSSTSFASQDTLLSPKTVQARLDDLTLSVDFFAPGNPRANALSLISDPRQKLVIYIQDAHGNTSAQKNISAILHLLSLQAGLKEPWIGLEGTRFGEIDHRLLSAYPNEPAKKLVTEYLLRRGELSGADDYVSLLNPTARLFGVDSGELAERNRQSYRNSLRFKEEADPILAKLEKINRLLKKRIYYGDVRLLDQTLEALSRDGRFFFKRVRTFKDLARRHALSPRKFRFLDRWENEKNLPPTSRASFLWEDIQKLGDRLWRKCLSYREARDAHAIDRALKFYEKLLNFSLVPEDYSQYLRRPESFALERLRNKIQAYTFILLPHRLRFKKAEMETLEEAAQTALGFYRLARRRDGILMRHLMTLSRRNPNPKTFLISGGFHSKQILKSLRERRIPFVVVTPKIEGRGGEENYWRLLAGDPPPLNPPLWNLSPSSVALPNIFASRGGRRMIRLLLAQVSRPDSRSETRTFNEFVIQNADPSTLAQNLADTIQRAAWEQSKISIGGKENKRLVGAFADVFKVFLENPLEVQSDLWKRSRFDLSKMIEGLVTYKVTVNFQTGSSLTRVDSLEDGKTIGIFIDPGRLQDLKTREESLGEGLPEIFLVLLLIKRLLSPYLTLVAESVKEDMKEPLRQALQVELRRNLVVAATRRLSEEKTVDAKQLAEAPEQMRQSLGPEELSWIGDLSKAIPLRPEITKLRERLTSEGFEIVEQIGSGAFGDIYLAEVVPQTPAATGAEDSETPQSLTVERPRKFVIIKTFKYSPFTPPERLAKRAENEVAILRAIDRLETVFRDKESGSPLALAMTLVKGKDLSEYLDRNLPPDPGDVIAWKIRIAEMVRIAIKAAEKIEILHRKGVVHRDIKPRNLIFDPNTGEVSVIDFGLARIEGQPDQMRAEFQQDVSQTTESNAVLGTPSFMAPEAAGGHIHDHREATDVFGLGATLFYMIFGLHYQDLENEPGLSQLQLAARSLEPEFHVLMDEKIIALLPEPEDPEEPNLLNILRRALAIRLAPPVSEKYSKLQENLESKFLRSTGTSALDPEIKEILGLTRYNTVAAFREALEEYAFHLRKTLPDHPQASGPLVSPSVPKRNRPPGYISTAEIPPQKKETFSRRSFVRGAAGAGIAAAIIGLVAYFFGPDVAAWIQRWLATQEKEPPSPKEVLAPPSAVRWSGGDPEEKDALKFEERDSPTGPWKEIEVGLSGIIGETSPPEKKQLLGLLTKAVDYHNAAGQFRVVAGQGKPLLGGRGPFMVPFLVLPPVSIQKEDQVLFSGSIWAERSPKEALLGLHNLETNQSTVFNLVPNVRLLKDIPTSFLTAGGATTRSDFNEALNRKENKIVSGGERLIPFPVERLMHFELTKEAGAREARFILRYDTPKVGEEKPFFDVMIPLEGNNSFWLQPAIDGAFIALEKIEVRKGRKAAAFPRSELRKALPATGRANPTPVLFLKWSQNPKNHWRNLFRPETYSFEGSPPRIVFLYDKGTRPRSEVRDWMGRLSQIYRGVSFVEGDFDRLINEADYADHLMGRAAVEVGVSRGRILPIALAETFPEKSVSSRSRPPTSRMIRLRTRERRFIFDPNYRFSRFRLAWLLSFKPEIEGRLVYHRGDESFEVPDVLQDWLNTQAEQWKARLYAYQSA